MTGRRGLLAGAAAIAGVLPIAAHGELPPSADADLLALCAEFHAKHAAVMAFGDTVATDAECDQLGAAMGERWAISDSIEVMTPRTAEGARAMAAVALALLAENHGEHPAESDARFAIAALRAVAG